MVGQVEEQDLRRGGDQDPLERPGASRQPFVQSAAPSALRMVPSRRMATTAIERASARSRASSPAKRGSASAAGEALLERRDEVSASAIAWAAASARRQTRASPRAAAAAARAPRALRIRRVRFAFNLNPAESRNREDMTSID